MADLARTVFKRIVLHNKLLTEQDLDSLLVEAPEPKAAVARMVAMERLSAKKGAQLLELYHTQLDKFANESRATAAAKAASTAGSGSSSIVLNKAQEPQPAQAEPPIDEMLDEIMGIKSPEPKPATAATAQASAVAAPAQPSPTKTQPSPAKTQPSPAKPQPSAAETKPAAAETQVIADTQTIPVAPERPATVRVISPAAEGDYRQQLINLLTEARDRKASDLHVKAGFPPVARIYSILVNLDMPPISPEMSENILLSVLDNEQRKTFLETNDLDFCFEGGGSLGRFRTNYLRQHRGMEGVFHLIPDVVPSFQELKLPDQVRKFTEYRVGIVLVTGPKGCGKTTTLAAMIDLINSTRPEHVIAIEDPIEFVHPCKKGHVNQRHVGPHTRSFANALRAALREAPDVIMVGEMRDLETTSLAITAAETGHLVLATLHTPNAVRTLGRVLDVFPPKEQGQIRAMLSESLRGIISQFLIPDVNGQSMHLAMEIMVNTPAIGNLIREDRTFQLKGMMQMGKKLGMMIMDESLMQLVKEGKISKEEALVRAEEPADMEKELAHAVP